MMSDTDTEHMLTTVDNPFNPFTQYDEWYTWDTRAGYHTLAYLARIVRTSSELSDADQDVAEEDAIREIVRENILGIYRAVPKSEKNSATKKILKEGEEKKIAPASSSPPP
jgi:hypothetical protein